MYLTFPFYKRFVALKQIGKIAEPKAVSKAGQITNEIMDLFHAHGAECHSNDQTSKSGHMIRCAMLAMENMSDLPVIISALLHDIGYMVQTKQMGTVTEVHDATYYETAGARYLRSKYFSERVCSIVEAQTQAKRYLTTVDKSFLVKLNPAALQALHKSGGFMKPEESKAFEKNPYYLDIVKVCYWHEQARSEHSNLLPVSCFTQILVDHLLYRTS